jgi:small conductance mechanosensitive channel
MHEWTFMTKYQSLKELMELYGHDLTQGMLILVMGLILLHWLIRRFKVYIDKHKGNQWPVKRISSIVYIVLLFFVLNVSLVRIGLDLETISRFLAIISLAAIALVIVLRPYLPTLPFHVGNVVLIDGLFGKVASTNMYHTQLKTFDGKMVFIPNSKIMKNVVTNYHKTPGRRVRVNVRIPYEQDLIKAKQILEAVMIADPRVLTTPRPQVWALDLEGGSVELGARCWANNENYWLTKCDLIEMIKLRFDHQNIRMALPMQQVYIRHQIGENGEPGCLENLTPTKEDANENQ